MLVFLATLLVFPPCVAAQMEQSLFDRLPAMDGKIVTSNVVMPQTKLDLGACSFHCLGNPKCKAFFHHKETSLCQLQAAKGFGGKAEKGWLHYYKKWESPTFRSPPGLAKSGKGEIMA